ncbi:MAG: hypothetical protein ACE5IG_06110 [Dehalococcoidia bacterium]
MDITQMRTRVRRDLRDEDPASQRWSDASLDRHIEHALQDLSLAIPLETVATLTTPGGSRDLSLASLSDLISAEAVEYPTGRYPVAYVPFSLWGDTLSLLVDQAPQAGEEVKIYYGKLHTLDALGSSLPPYLEELVAVGAEGYAALEWATFATNRTNVGGPQTWRHYLTWGQERLAQFHKGLARLSRRNTVRVRRLYPPAHSLPSSTSLGSG